MRRLADRCRYLPRNSDPCATPRATNFALFRAASDALLFNFARQESVSMIDEILLYVPRGQMKHGLFSRAIDRRSKRARENRSAATRAAVPRTAAWTVHSRISR